MKILAVYWMAGCLLYGVGAGMWMKKCPSDKSITAVELASAISVWPATLIAVTISYDGPAKCDAR